MKLSKSSVKHEIIKIICLKKFNDVQKFQKIYKYHCFNSFEEPITVFRWCIECWVEKIEKHFNFLIKLILTNSTQQSMRKCFLLLLKTNSFNLDDDSKLSKI